MSDKENENESQMTFSSSGGGRLNESDRFEVRQKYKTMLDEIAVDEAGQAETSRDEERLKNALDRADDLFPLVDAPQEAVLDARVFRHLSRMCRQFAESLSTNSQEFLAGEYALRLAEDSGAEADETNGKSKLNLQHWIALGQKASNIFSCSPQLNYLYGSLDKRDIVIEKKERARRSTVNQKSDDTTKVKVLGQDAGAEEGGNKKTLTERLVESTLRHLTREFKKENRQPLCYFRFVIHPDDFGQTVENMFYVSFLVKEGRAKIYVDPEDGLPKIIPVGKSQSTQEEALERKQVVVSLTMPDWEALKTSLAITKATITHEVALAANKN